MQNRDLVRLFSIEFNDCVYFSVYLIPSEQIIYISCPSGKIIIRDLEGIGHGMHFRVQGYRLDKYNKMQHTVPCNYKENRKVTGLIAPQHYMCLDFENNTSIVCTFSEFGKILTLIDGKLVIINSIRHFQPGQPLSLKYYQIDSENFQRIGDSIEQDFGILKGVRHLHSL